MRSQTHPQLRPRLEVIRRIDAPRSPLRLANRPELRKRRRPFNRGRIVSSRSVDVVRTPIRAHRSTVRTPTAGVVRPVRFNDVILNQRVLGPAVYGEVAVAAGVEASAVVYGSGTVI